MHERVAGGECTAYTVAFDGVGFVRLNANVRFTLRLAGTALTGLSKHGADILPSTDVSARRAIALESTYMVKCAGSAGGVSFSDAATSSMRRLWLHPCGAGAAVASVRASPTDPSSTAREEGLWGARRRTVLTELAVIILSRVAAASGGGSLAAFYGLVRHGALHRAQPVHGGPRRLVHRGCLLERVVAAVMCALPRPTLRRHLSR